MDQKLTVALLNDSFPPTIDGVANTVVNYASVIERKYGHAIVATPDYPGVQDDYPFEVLRYPSLDTTKLVGYRFGLPLNINFISQFPNKNVDIIHSHCPVSSNFLARGLRDTIRKPIVMTYHTKFDIDIRKAVNMKLIQDAAIKALVDSISACDEVWAVSKGAGENLKSLGYKGDYIVMPNGVDFEKGKASKQAIEELSNEYLLRSDVPVYLFVGRMMWYKGLKIILDALKILQDQGKQFVMIFVGSGMDKEEVEQYAIDLQLMRHCRFIGPVRDRNRLKAFYSRADLFLFPSTFDTNGIVVGEAAASGLASVLIRGSCAAEEVTENRNAFLIEENAESLAQFLLRHGDQLDYLHQIGTNAMNEIYVSWEDSIANAVARYPEVIKKFEYQAPNLLNGTMMDNIIKTSGDMATALDLVHKVNTTISTSINEVLDRWL